MERTAILHNQVCMVAASHEIAWYCDILVHSCRSALIQLYLTVILPSTLLPPPTLLISISKQLLSPENHRQALYHAVEHETWLPVYNAASRNSQSTSLMSKACPSIYLAAQYTGILVHYTHIHRISVYPHSTSAQSGFGLHKVEYFML
jgi:hypothetical protein